MMQKMQALWMNENILAGKALEKNKRNERRLRS